MANWRQADDFLDAYTAGLIRQEQGVIVPRVEAEAGVGLRPNFCHENVAKWIERYPGCSIVPGWLFFDLEAKAPLLGLPPYLEYLPHSVVRDADGNLVDVTPVYQGAGYYPFISHEGPHDVYARVVNDYRIVRIRVMIGPPTRVFYSDE